jgi:hypothetical protein
MRHFAAWHVCCSKSHPPRQGDINNGENHKGEKAMKGISGLIGFRRALALAAILAMNGTALAKKPDAGGVPAELSGDRTTVNLTINLQCNPATTLNAQGSLSVYIFQSVGRLINIGTFNTNVPCTGSATAQTVTVEAIDGLSFQPGPATLIYRFTTQDSVSLITTVQESGARLNLHQ